MSKAKYCIFACGGKGVRMGADLPKQFLRIGDKTILQLSIEKVMDAVPGVRIVIALPSQYIQFWKDECAKNHFDIRQSIVEGGLTRFHSIRNALERVPEDAIVAVHDAVRPFVSTQLIVTLFDQAENVPAVIPVVPVTDTLKVLKKNEEGLLVRMEGESADRSVLFGAQTPQVFDSSVLKRAYAQAYETSFTDDASVVEALGISVKYIPGEKYNIKLTTPEDMDIAQFLLRRD